MSDLGEVWRQDAPSPVPSGYSPCQDPPGPCVTSSAPGASPTYVQNSQGRASSVTYYNMPSTPTTTPTDTGAPVVTVSSTRTPTATDSSTAAATASPPAGSTVLDVGQFGVLILALGLVVLLLGVIAVRGGK